MKTIGAYQAKTRLSKVLDDVERGEEIVITRNGRPVAILKTYPEQRPDVKARLLAYRRRHRIERRGITSAEILQFRDEGRK